MQRCLQLAELGAGNTAPNPMVGAVLVYNDIIIGEGYHKQHGEAHAEVNCINNVTGENKQFIGKSTLYVSLEPCAHFGKTPPCADLIIAMRIPRVVIGCRDSYAEVDGKGIEKLKAAGVEVITGVEEEAAKNLNRRFFTFHREQRPYIVLKWAQSCIGMIANDDYSRVLISNDYSNRLVHKWRTEEAAIMTGTNTALHDNPSLTSRYWAGNNPVRVVIDKQLKIPSSHHLISDGGRTIIFNEVKEGRAGALLFKKLVPEQDILPQVLKELYALKILSVLVEGGAKLLQSFIDEGLWDEARVITNQELMIHNGINAPLLKACSLNKTETWVSDTIHYYIRAKHE